jgi:hypothetical protein
MPELVGVDAQRRFMTDDVMISHVSHSEPLEEKCAVSVVNNLLELPVITSAM